MAHIWLCQCFRSILWYLQIWRITYDQVIFFLMKILFQQEIVSNDAVLYLILCCQLFKVRLQHRQHFLVCLIAADGYPAMVAPVPQVLYQCYGQQSRSCPGIQDRQHCLLRERKHPCHIFRCHLRGKELSVPLSQSLGYRLHEGRCCGICFFKNSHIRLQRYKIYPRVAYKNKKNCY